MKKLLFLMILCLTVSSTQPFYFPYIREVEVNRFGDVRIIVIHNTDFVLWFSLDNMNYAPLGIVFKRPNQEVFSLQWQDRLKIFPTGFFVVTPAVAVR